MTSNSRIYLRFAIGSLVVLVAGYVVTVSGEAIAKKSGLGNTFGGAILVAIATSLPVVSATSKAIRLRAYSMAFANIFGSNAFDVSLFFVGDLIYREGPIFEAAAPSALFLAGLGIIMTCAYLWGMLERKDTTIFGMGIASAIVLFGYVGGMMLLHTVMKGTP
jgi:cation:H+ antiporter